MDVFNKYIGQVFDKRYKIERTVGVGGMAVVFEGMDILLGRKVAVKMLHDNISNEKNAIHRFITESRAIAMLDNKNIVKIYDVAIRDDIKYLVMEYIKGFTLRDYMNRVRKMDWREAIFYVEQVLLALEHAHMRGVVHRDIKPQNIMLLRDRTVKVTDFGIAKLATSETFTQADKAIGTVYYISPEQAQGNGVDSRSDIYSVGVMLYEMISGQLPFIAESPTAVMYKQIHEKEIPISQLVPDIPRGMEQIIATAMSKNPDDRYQSASQMLRHIHRVSENPEAILSQNRPRRTPTAQVTIKSTTRGPSSQTEINERSRKNELAARAVASPTDKGQLTFGDDSEFAENARKRRGNRSGKSLGSAAVIAVLALFTALAVVGIILLYSLLFKTSLPGAVPPAEVSAVAAALGNIIKW